MKIVNLTPHAITIPGLVRHVGPSPADVVLDDWTLSPSGAIARCAEQASPAAPIDGIPTSRVAFGAVEGLPVPAYEERPTACAGIPASDLCPECGGMDGHVSLTYHVPAIYYVVSIVVAQAARASGRAVDDLLTPGQQIRDSDGRVIGCRSLARVG